MTVYRVLSYHGKHDDHCDSHLNVSEGVALVPVGAEQVEVGAEKHRGQSTSVDLDQ